MRRGNNNRQSIHLSVAPVSARKGNPGSKQRPRGLGAPRQTPRVSLMSAGHARFAKLQLSAEFQTLNLMGHITG